MFKPDVVLLHANSLAHCHRMSQYIARFQYYQYTGNLTLKQYSDFALMFVVRSHYWIYIESAYNEFGYYEHLAVTSKVFSAKNTSD